jgi:hypothetical protein
LVAKSQDTAIKDEEGWENEFSIYTNEVLYIPAITDSWYTDMTFFLHHGTCPRHMNSK